MKNRQKFYPCMGRGYFPGSFFSAHSPDSNTKDLPAAPVSFPADQQVLNNISRSSGLLIHYLFF